MAIFTLLGALTPTAVLAADKPTGELRIAFAFLGAQRMIPMGRGALWRHQAIPDLHL